MIRNRAAAVVIVCAVALAGSTGHAVAQPAGPRWAPAGQAPVHPGVQTISQSGQCTANFVFYDDVDVYIGQAAHCTGTGGPTDINGCEAGVLPLGTPVEIGGATRPGHIAYNSWITMQAVGERSENVCYGNDFALIRVDPADRARVNPSIPFWGGPIGLDPSSGPFETVYAYGNSGLRGGITALSPKIGVALGDQGGGWTHELYAVTPGIPGDSGSAFLGSDGGALGVLSTFSAYLSNQVSDLSRAMSYMREYTDFDAVQLANGTEPFSPVL